MQRSEASAALGDDVVGIVLTFNSADVIESTLRAVQCVSHHVVVVDSGSSDGTAELAERLGCHVARRAFKNYADQRNWAISEFGARHSWQLHVDADEILDPTAIRAIRTAVRSPGRASGFLIRRRTYFMGRLLRFGGTTTWHLRLFRSDAGRCEDRLYDQHFKCDGPTARLTGYLHDMNVGGISEWTAKHNRWADMEADELSRSNSAEGQIGSRLFGDDPRERRRYYKNRYYRAPLVLRPIAYFFIRYFFQLGFLDGRIGLLYAILQGLWFRMLVDAKLMERQFPAIPPEISRLAPAPLSEDPAAPQRA